MAGTGGSSNRLPPQSTGHGSKSEHSGTPSADRTFIPLLHAVGSGSTQTYSVTSPSSDSPGCVSKHQHPYHKWQVAGALCPALDTAARLVRVDTWLHLITLLPHPDLLCGHDALEWNRWAAHRLCNATSAAAASGAEEAVARLLTASLPWAPWPVLETEQGSDHELVEYTRLLCPSHPTLPGAREAVVAALGAGHYQLAMQVVTQLVDPYKTAQRGNPDIQWVSHLLRIHAPTLSAAIAARDDYTCGRLFTKFGTSPFWRMVLVCLGMRQAVEVGTLPQLLAHMPFVGDMPEQQWWGFLAGAVGVLIRKCNEEMSLHVLDQLLLRIAPAQHSQLLRVFLTHITQPSCLPCRRALRAHDMHKQLVAGIIKRMATTQQPHEGLHQLARIACVGGIPWACLLTFQHLLNHSDAQQVSVVFADLVMVGMSSGRCTDKQGAGVVIGMLQCLRQSGVKVNLDQSGALTQ